MMEIGKVGQPMADLERSAAMSGRCWGSPYLIDLICHSIAGKMLTGYGRCHILNSIRERLAAWRY